MIMGENNHNCPSKQSFDTTRARSHSFIKDGDLQIQFAHTKETNQAENMEVFKNLYAHYTSKIKKAPNPAPEKPNAVQEVTHEMEEAKITYNMMMDISHSIAEAYKDLKKLE